MRHWENGEWWPDVVVHRRMPRTGAPTDGVQSGRFTITM